MSSEHHAHLQMALTLAQKAKGQTLPNPAVGALVVKAGRVIGVGYHQKAGESHAEPQALQMAGTNASGADLYVTLEPCCHFGRTPPCTSAIIQAGISRVFYAFPDPNPEVREKSAEILRVAGIDSQHVPLPEINLFYRGYTHWRAQQRPYVTAKIAMSIDGKVAGINRQPVMITGSACQQFTHQERQMTDAILTTVNTIIQDDPALNCRLNDPPLAKTIFVLDSQLRLPMDRQLFKTAAKIIVLHDEQASVIKKDVLAERGVECIAIARAKTGAAGLSLDASMALLGQRGVHDLWVEAGPTLWWALKKQNLLNRWLLYLSLYQVGLEGFNFFNNAGTLINADDHVRWIPAGNDVIIEWEKKT